MLSLGFADQLDKIRKFLRKSGVSLPSSRTGHGTDEEVEEEEEGEKLDEMTCVVRRGGNGTEPRIPAYGGGRLPLTTHLADRVRALQKAAAARYELVMRPAETVHRPWLEHNLGQVHTALAWLDRQLAGPWLTGDTITQADVTTVVMYDFLRLFEESRVDDGMVPAIAAMAASAASLAPFAETRP